MALALNNLQKVDMPLNKETKPNQPNQQSVDISPSKKVSFKNFGYRYEKLDMLNVEKTLIKQHSPVHSEGVVKYTGCISAEE